MAFLTLNGLTVAALADTATDAALEIGSREISFDGGLHKNIRALKRQWQFETPPMRERDFEALRGLVLGLGQHWSFDTSHYSSAGVYPSTIPSVYTIHSATGADGYSVDGAGAFSKSGSIEIDVGATNILPADARDAENAPTGYSASGASATLSADTTHKWQGSKSLKTVMVTIGHGCRTDVCDPGAGSATKTFTGTVYLAGDAGGESVGVYLYDVTNAASGTTVNKTLTTAGTWYRVKCQITIGGVDCRSLRIIIVGNAANLTWYSDGFQIEQSSYETAWYDGTRATAGNPLVYPAAWLAYGSDVSISFWTKGPGYGAYGGSGNANGIIDLNFGANNAIQVYSRYDGSNNYLSVYAYRSTTGTLDTYDGGTLATNLWDGTWHNYVIAFRAYPESDQYHATTYRDGVAIGTLTMSVFPAKSTSPANWDIRVGAAGGGWWAYYTGMIDDLVVVPYAISPSQAAAIYALGTAYSDLPYVKVDGDALPGPVDALGETEDSRNTGYFDTAWRGNAKSLRFRLREK